MPVLAMRSSPWRTGRWIPGASDGRKEVSRLYPCCGLPIAPETVASTVAVTSHDRQLHGTYALCKCFDRDNRDLPEKAVFKRLSRVGDRALARPDRYLCTLYSDIATASLAVAMAGHPHHAQQAIAALVWKTEQL